MTQSEKAEVRRQKAESRSQLTFRFLPSYFLLFISVCLFLYFGLRQLHLPGFYYDEGFDLTPMLSLMHREPAELLRGIGFLGYPVMRMDYMGSLNGYLTLPFMRVLGSGYLAARLQPLFFSLITLVLTFVLARRWFGMWVAAITTLLLSVNPSFVWFTRQGITVTSVMTVFSLASWLFLDNWRRDLSQPPISSRHSFRTNLQLFFAGICLGLGFWAKIIFLWWLVLTGVIALVWLLTYKTQNRFGLPKLRLLSRKHGPILAHYSAIEIALHASGLLLIGFIVGASPFIYYNLAGLAQGQPPATFQLLFNALVHPTEYAIRNSNFFANLNKRFQDFATFLNGSYFWYLASVPFGNVFAVPTFLASVFVGSVLAVRQNTWRKWLALLLCITLYLPLSSFTVSDLWATHFFILLPLPQLIVACAAVWLAQWLSHRLPVIQSPHRPIIAAALTLAFLAPTFTRDLWVNQQYHSALAQSGGSGRFSDAVYKLAAHLDQQKVAEPVALDWGISQQMRVLTNDRVRPREVFGFTNEITDAFKAQVRTLLQNPSNQYVVLWEGDQNFPGFAVFNRRAAFTELAQETGKRVREVFIAHEKSGIPVYVVLQAD